MQQDYNEFVEKFKPKLTTDDCYTPPRVYDTVLNYVCHRWNIKPETVVRPFYPGGDYEHFDYEGRVVVDNPPFSILMQIIRFYMDHDIKFFLFGPALTLFSYGYVEGVNLIFTSGQIIYENGARVKTGYLTNMPAHKVETAPQLSEALKEVQRKNDERPKVDLPQHVYKSTDFIGMANRGELVRLDDVTFKRKFDGRPIFGSCCIDNERYTENG